MPILCIFLSKGFTKKSRGKDPVKSNLKETESGIKKLLEEFLCNKSDFFIVKNTSLYNKNKEFLHIMRDID